MYINLCTFEYILGYVHVRCVDDYSKLDRTASSKNALENGQDGSVLDPSLKENGIRSSSGSYLEMEPVPQPAPSPTPSLKKQLAFKVIPSKRYKKLQYLCLLIVLQFSGEIKY